MSIVQTILVKTSDPAVIAAGSSALSEADGYRLIYSDDDRTAIRRMDEVLVNLFLNDCGNGAEVTPQTDEDRRRRGMGQGRAQAGVDLARVGRDQDDHARDRPRDRDILMGLVRRFAHPRKTLKIKRDEGCLPATSSRRRWTC